MGTNQYRSAEADPAKANDLWRVAPLIHFVRYMTAFTKGLFAQCPAGAYRWDPESERSPDQKGSEIFITSETPIKTKEYVGHRPAIAITRGPAAGQGIGLNDQAFVDLATGAVSKMDIFPTTLNINVVSRIGYEAEQLCWFVGHHVWALREMLIKNQSGLLYIGNRPSYSPVSPAGSLVAPDTEENWVAATASFPTYLQHSAHTMPLNQGAGTGIVQSIAAFMQATRDGADGRPEPVVPLQGTAVQQPKTVPEVVTGSGPALPPDPSDEAQSTDEPLTVLVKT